MPLYEYKCGNCGHKFTETRKVDDRDQPLQTPCTDCGEYALTRPIGNPTISYGGLSMSKVPDAFKDKLREVKKQNPRSNINI